MSKILNNVRGRRLPPAASIHSLQTPSTGGLPRTRSATHLAPVVLEIDDNFTSASSLDGDADERLQAVSGHRLAPKLDTNVIIAPASSAFATFKRFCRRAYRKLGLKHLLSIALIVFYTIVGAGIFMAIERSTDADRLAKDYASYMEKRNAFVRALSNDMASVGRTASSARIRQIIDFRLSNYENSIEFSVQNETDWNFWHAMYFAGTIYTTIGYGDIYCRTTGGRLFTIIYSLIGIPLVLSVLTDLGSLLLKFLFHITRLQNKFVALLCPSGVCGPHSSAPDDPSAAKGKKRDAKKHVEKNDDTNKNETLLEIEEEPEQQSASDDEIDDLDELERREDEIYEYQLTRVPVLTALLATVGWIFVCAGLFCFWEDWTYFTSIYFFFISLSTIGLGDETPKRKDIMVSTYLLVIVGLALVSMCITVIQRRLEDLYLQLLRMILQEYHKQLREGGDQMGATMGIMNFWNQNKAAKYLMPLLSKDKKQNVAQKFQDEAKAKGFAIPAVLRDLDPKTGVPAVLKVTKDKAIDGQAQLREAVSVAISRAAGKARAKHEPDDDAALDVMYNQRAAPSPVEPTPPIPPVPAPPPPPIAYDADTQTEELQMEDKQQQTLTAMHVDVESQSEESWLTGPLRVDEACQTAVVYTTDAWVQYETEEEEEEEAEEAEEAPQPVQLSSDVETQTETLQTLEAAIQAQEEIAVSEQGLQTETIQMAEASVETQKTVFKDRVIQTHIYDLNHAEIQTEPVQTKNQRLQTPIPETLEQESQTDPMPDPQTPTTSQKWGKAKTNLHDIIKKAMSNMQTSSSKSKLSSAAPSLPSLDQEPAMANWSDVVADVPPSSEEEEDEPAPAFRLKRRGRREPEPVEPEPGPSQYKLRKVKPEDRSKRVRQNLHWDPVDGLHAEKQRRVSDLKQLFEKQQQMKIKNGNEAAAAEEEEEEEQTEEGT